MAKKIVIMIYHHDTITEFRDRLGRPNEEKS